MYVCRYHLMDIVDIADRPTSTRFACGCGTDRVAQILPQPTAIIAQPSTYLPLSNEHGLGDFV